MPRCHFHSNYRGMPEVDLKLISGFNHIHASCEKAQYSQKWWIRWISSSVRRIVCVHLCQESQRLNCRESDGPVDSQHSEEKISDHADGGHIYNGEWSAGKPHGQGRSAAIHRLQHCLMLWPPHVSLQCHTSLLLTVLAHSSIISAFFWSEINHAISIIQNHSQKNRSCVCLLQDRRSKTWHGDFSHSAKSYCMADHKTHDMTNPCSDVHCLFAWRNEIHMSLDVSGSVHILLAILDTMSYTRLAVFCET